MIHVDVSRDGDGVCRVETSVEGGTFTTQYTVERRQIDQGTYESDNDQNAHAIEIARVFANGCTFAGATTRVTAFGDELNSIGMPKQQEAPLGCNCPMSVRNAMGGMSATQDGPHHSRGCPRYRDGGIDVTPHATSRID